MNRWLVVLLVIGGIALGVGLGRQVGNRITPLADGRFLTEDGVSGRARVCDVVTYSELERIFPNISDYSPSVPGNRFLERQSWSQLRAEVDSVLLASESGMTWRDGWLCTAPIPMPE